MSLNAIEEQLDEYNRGLKNQLKSIDSLSDQEALLVSSSEALEEGAEEDSEDCSSDADPALRYDMRKFKQGANTGRNVGKYNCRWN